LPEIERQQAQSKEVVFRADTAFAKPKLYASLEERDVNDAICFLLTIFCSGIFRSC